MISKNISKHIAIFILFVLITLSFLIYSTTYEITSEETIHLNRLAALELIEEDYILSVLNENYCKAQIQAKGVADRIKANSYDINGLKTLAPNSEILTDLNTFIEGKFLNIDSDSNDMFVAVHNTNAPTNAETKVPLKDSFSFVLVDKSLDCSVATGAKIRDWETEISAHANKELAQHTIVSLLNKQNVPLFWQFLPSDIDTSKVVSVSDIIELYHLYGIKGIDAFEFLSPVYLNARGDLWGEEYVNNIGIRNDAYMLIVVQGFKLSDAITSNSVHREYLQQIKHFRGDVIDNYNVYHRGKQLLLVAQTVIFLLSFIGLSILQKDLR